MRQDLRPSERAIGKSPQEGNGVRDISLALKKNSEGRLLRGNDSASFQVVANALTTGEPSLRRRARLDAGVGDHAKEIGHISLLIQKRPPLWRASERLLKAWRSSSGLGGGRHVDEQRDFSPVRQPAVQLRQRREM